MTTYEGDPLPSGDIASRLGGFADVDKMEKDKATDGDVIEVLLGNKNNLHNNYQDYQAFLDRVGTLARRHAPRELPVDMLLRPLQLPAPASSGAKAVARAIYRCWLHA